MSEAGASIGAPRTRYGPLLWAVPLGAVIWSAAWSLGIPAVVIALIALTCAGLLFWKKPAETIAMMPIFIIPPQFLKVFTYEVVLGAVFAVLVWIGWVRREQWVRRIAWFEILVFALFAWGVFTIFWVRDSWWWLFGVRKYLMGFLALWVSWRMARFVKPELLLVGVAAGACALSTATLHQAIKVGFFHALVQNNALRREATELGWGAANYLAALMALMLPTGIHIAMHGTKPFYRALGWASIPLSALLVTLAASRGGALLVFAVALFAIFRSRIKPWMAITTAVLLISLLLLGPGASLLMNRFTTVEDMGSVVIRLMYFREAWHRMLDYWPRGMGLGGSVNYPWDRLWDDDPHNYWLVLGGELGALGVILWLAISIALWRRIMRIERVPETRAEGRAMQLTFVIAQMNLMWEPTFQGLQYHALFYWVFGSYFGYLEWKQRSLAGLKPVASPEPSAPGPAALAP